MQTHYEPPETSVVALELDPRTTAALTRLGIHQLSDLAEWSEHMLREAGIHEEQVHALSAAMFRMGLTLAEDRQLRALHAPRLLDAELQALMDEYEHVSLQAEDGIRAAATEAAIVL